jgi:hypothetical protein
MIPWDPVSAIEITWLGIISGFPWLKTATRFSVGIQFHTCSNKTHVLESLQHINNCLSIEIPSCFIMQDINITLAQVFL